MDLQKLTEAVHKGLVDGILCQDEDWEAVLPTGEEVRLFIEPPDTDECLAEMVQTASVCTTVATIVVEFPLDDNDPAGEQQVVRRYTMKLTVELTEQGGGTENDAKSTLA